MSTSSIPTPPASNSTLPTVAQLIERGDARVVLGLNATDTDVVGKESPAALTGAAVPPLRGTYHNTGIQTQPLCNGFQFWEIYGREPTMHEIETKIGSAGIGRYEKAFEIKPHQLAYGVAFSVDRVPEAKKSYADSGFQTTDFADTKKALAKAKLKASVTANKYRRVAEEAGYKVWAESKEEKVIHSEQFPVTIQLDADGNAKDADLDGVLLPNLHGEEIEPVRISTKKPVLPHQPAAPTSCPPTRHVGSHVHVPTVQGLTPPLTPGLTKRQEVLRPISALAPSLREADPDPESIEDYGYESSLDQDPEEFVVYDAAKFAVPPPPKAPPTSPASSRKRKANEPTDMEKQQNSPKRPKNFGPQNGKDSFIVEPLKHKIPSAVEPLKHKERQDAAPSPPSSRKRKSDDCVDVEKQHIPPKRTKMPTPQNVEKSSIVEPPTHKDPLNTAPSPQPRRRRRSVERWAPAAKDQHKPEVKVRREDQDAEHARAHEVEEPRWEKGPTLDERKEKKEVEIEKPQQASASDERKTEIKEPRQASASNERKTEIEEPRRASALNERKEKRRAEIEDPQKASASNERKPELEKPRQASALHERNEKSKSEIEKPQKPSASNERKVEIKEPRQASALNERKEKRKAQFEDDCGEQASALKEQKEKRKAEIEDRRQASALNGQKEKRTSATEEPRPRRKVRPEIARYDPRARFRKTK